MRRLLIVSLSPAFGGAERSMLLLARHLPDHGWRAVLACPAGELARLARDARITVETTPWRPVDAVSRWVGEHKRYPTRALTAAVGGTLSNAARTAVLARRMRVDAILSNSLHAHPFVTLGGHLAGRTVVWHLRDIVDPGPGRLLLAAAGRCTHGVLAVSQAVAETVRHRRTLVLHNPVEMPRAVPRQRPARVVGFIGRIDPEKGLDELIRAAEFVDATFVVVGEPRFAPTGYLDHLKTAAELRAPGRLEFVDAVAEPSQVLPDFTVLAVPSRREPFGRVAAEALSHGVPVVAAATGGLPEVIRDGVDGLLYPAGDSDALAGRLRRLLDDGELRARMSAAAIAGAARFVPSSHARAAAGFLDGIVSTSSTCRRSRQRRPA